MKNNACFFVPMLIVFASVFSCSDPEHEAKPAQSIPKEYWGTWIQMDNGKEYYIDFEAVKTSSGSYTEESIGDFSFDGANILRKGSTVYFRKGGSARSFSTTVSGFSDSRAARMSSGTNVMAAGRRSTKNSADSQTVISDENGKCKFSDAVAGDAQIITVSGISATVNPNYDGENCGTIPIVESGAYGFKTTYEINGDEQGFCYGNNYKNYSLTLKLTNIGFKTCSTSVYEISCDDSKLSFVSEENLTGNFSSIEPEKYKEIDLRVKYGDLTEEYVDVPIKISITDSDYERTWEDTVTLRFYKGVVKLNVDTHTFGNYASLNGFLIYPDGRSSRFSGSGDVLIPWSEKDYMLAFSGAVSGDDEIGYVFGFEGKTTLPDISGNWTIAEVNAYEPNDSTKTSYKVENLSQPIKAYLKPGDIDFYTINCSTCSIESSN